MRPHAIVALMGVWTLAAQAAAPAEPAPVVANSPLPTLAQANAALNLQAQKALDTVTTLAPPPPKRRKTTAQEIKALRSRVKVLEATPDGVQYPYQHPMQRSSAVFTYSPYAVYTLYASPGMNTVIYLEPGEYLTGQKKPALGDSEHWLVGTTQTGSGSDAITLVVIRPDQTGLTTNMMLATNRRVYLFDLESRKDFYLPAAHFRYPDEEMAALTAQQDSLALGMGDANGKSSLAIDPSKYNPRWRIEGPDVPWKPLRVFDDGSKTYIQMPTAMNASEAPALFVIGDDKTPQVVNYRVLPDKNLYVMDRVPARAELRIGEKTRVELIRESQ
jgi:type IV secretion system protein TrbG